MEITLLVMLAVIAVVNLVVSIGIAGSAVKLIRYIEEEGEILTRREISDRDPFYDGVAPRPPNSDGAGGMIED